MLKRKDDVLYEGDIVYLSIFEQGLVHSDGFVDERVGCLSNVSSGDFDGCLFRIVPKLVYEAQKLVERAKGAITQASEKYAMLQQQVHLEDAMNLERLREMDVSVQMVMYGQPIQLQHIRSGKFLALKAKTVADMDKTSMKLHLEERGSSKCAFTFLPRFKAKTIGNPITFNDSVTLARSKYTTQYVHLSSKVYTHDRYHRKEINLNTKDTIFSIHLHAPHVADSNGTWQATKLYRLYHVEAQAYLTMSTNINTIKPAYLRPIIPDTDPNAQENLTLKGLFVLERQNFKKGGVILDENERIRFRHLITGRYLAFNDTQQLVGIDRILSSSDATFRLVRVVSNDNDMCHIEGYYSSQWRRLHHANQVKTKELPRGKHKMSYDLIGVTGNTEQDGFHLVEASATESFEAKFLAIALEHLKGYQHEITKALKTNHRVTFIEMTNKIAALRATMEFVQSPKHQLQARQAKFIDILYEMLRVTMSAPQFNGNQQLLASDPFYKVIHTLHRHINRTIVCLAEQNLANKDYIATKSAAKYYHNPIASTTTYSNETLNYVGTETGSKTVYRTLFLDNWELLKSVDDQVVLACCRGIQKKGVKASGILNFLATICSCNDKSLSNNQEIIARLLFAMENGHEIMRPAIIIETTLCTTGSRLISKGVKSMVASQVTKLNLKPNPLGYDMLETGVADIAISWKAFSAWTVGDDSLFFTPKALNLSTRDDALIPLELADYFARLPKPQQQTDSSAVSAEPPPAAAPESPKTKKALTLGRILLAPVALPSIDTESTDAPVATDSAESPSKPTEESIPQQEQPPERLAPGEAWVLLEHVVWVLEPQSLYSVIFEGLKWEDYTKKMSKNKSLQVEFDRLKELAQYYHLQLLLFVQLLRGNNLSSTKVLREQFSYRLLLSGISNERLPKCIRTAFSTLINYCYVDAFPHEPITFFKRVYDIDDIQDDTTMLLPAFSLHPRHPALTIYSDNSFITYPHPTKFIMLQAMVHACLSTIATLRVKEITLPVNELALALLKIASNLLSFGFYFDMDAQKALVNVLLCLVDGRNTLDQDIRYAKSDLNYSFTKAKTQACQILTRINTIWQSQEARYILSHFKSKYSIAKKPSYKSNTQWRESLMKKVVRILDRNSSVPNLTNVSSNSIDYICMDLLMYEDTDLVQAALSLHVDLNTRKERIIALILQCMVLEKPQIPLRTMSPTEVVCEVGAILPGFRHYMSIYSSPNACEAAIDPDTKQPLGIAGITAELIRMLQQLERYTYDKDHLIKDRVGARASCFWGLLKDDPASVRYTPNCTIQVLMLMLDVHLDAITLINLRLDSVPHREELLNVKAECCRLLVALVTKNPQCQQVLFNHIEHFWDHFDEVDGMGDVLLAVFLDNKQLISRLPQKAIWSMAQLLNEHSKRLEQNNGSEVAKKKSFTVMSTIIDLFKIYIAPNDVPIKQNQTIVYQVISHPQFQHILLNVTEGIQPDDGIHSDMLMESKGYCTLRSLVLNEKAYLTGFFQKMIILLSLLCQGKNHTTELQCQQLYPLNLCLTVLLDAKMPMGAKYVFLRYFTEVYIFTDVELQLGSTATALMQLVLQHSTILDEYASSSSNRFLYQLNDMQFSKLYTTYIFDGILVFVSSLFSHHIKKAGREKDADIASIVAAFEHALLRILDLDNLTAEQSKICQSCLHMLTSSKDNVNSNVQAPNAAGNLESASSDTVDSSDTSFEQFKLDIQDSPHIQSAAAMDFNTLVKLWANIEKKTAGNQHSTNMSKFGFYSKVIRYLEAMPSSCATGHILDVFLELVSQYNIPEEKKKKLELAQIEEAADTYRNEQLFLANCGVPNLVLKLIAGGYSTAITSKAITLGIELMRGGNMAVQKLFYGSMKDGDERFFKQVELILNANIEAVKDSRRKMKFVHEVLAPQQRRRSSFFSMPITMPKMNAQVPTVELVSSDNLVEFLTCLAEGHYLDMQLAMLDQHHLGNTNSVNILQVVICYLSALAKDEAQLRLMTARDCASVNQCWLFLIEYMQGPCSLNQEFLTNSGMVDIFGKLLGAQINEQISRYEDKPSKEDIKQLKANAVKAMVSLLEGRTNRRVENRLRGTLGLKAIKNRLIDIYTQFHAEKHLHLDDSIWDERFLEEGVNLFTLAQCVFATSSGNASEETLEPIKDNGAAPRRANYTRQVQYEAAIKEYQTNALYAKTFTFFKAIHCSVEIWWGTDEPRLDTIYFPLPSHCRMLPFLAAKKDALLHSLNYKSNERLQQLVRAVGDLNEEMAHVEKLSQFRFYNFLRPYIPLFKHLSFLLAIFMNLIMLVSVVHMNQSNEYVFVPSKLKGAMFAFGITQIFLSSAVVVFMLVISIPLVFRRRLNAMLKYSMMEYKERKATLEEVDLLDLDAIKVHAQQRVNRVKKNFVLLFTSYLPLLKLTALIYLLQFTLLQAFPTFPSDIPYIILFLPIVRNTRHYLNTSSSIVGLVYTFIYDVLFEKLAAFYVVYLGTAFAATFYHPIFYFYHLLDLVIMNPTLQNVVLAVIRPGRLLALTALMCLCIVYFYSMIIFFYDVSLLTDDQNTTPYCKTLLDCYVTVVHRGLTSGGGIGIIVSTSLSHPPNFYTRNEYWGRLVFDVSFFAVKVVMLNMVFGITIDTFGGLRTEANEKENLKRNQCFICGHTRDQIDKEFLALGIPDGFQKHITQEHNMWHYVYFIVHLESLAMSECTGPEAYVKNLLSKSDCSWFPQAIAKSLNDTKATSIKQELCDIKAQVSTLASQTDGAMRLFCQRRERRLSKLSTRAV